jgi:DNA-binding NtrC family response regulator
VKAQKILIVDDDFPSRAAMEKVLQVYGYETFSCESAEHAAPKIREESFGILITDFQVRGMDFFLNLLNGTNSSDFWMASGWGNGTGIHQDDQMKERNIWD